MYRKRKEDKTDIAGKFCDPDVHSKFLVKFHHILNELMGVQAVPVHSHEIKLKERTCY